MKPKIPKWDSTETTPAAPIDGKTRPPDVAVDETAAKAFREVQPTGFKDHADSSIEAAVVDPDVEDSKGGE